MDWRDAHELCDCSLTEFIDKNGDEGRYEKANDYCEDCYGGDKKQIVTHEISQDLKFSGDSFTPLSRAPE